MHAKLSFYLTQIFLAKKNPFILSILKNPEKVSLQNLCGHRRTFQRFAGKGFNCIEQRRKKSVWQLITCFISFKRFKKRWPFYCSKTDSLLWYPKSKCICTIVVQFCCIAQGVTNNFLVSSMPPPFPPKLKILFCGILKAGWDAKK